METLWNYGSWASECVYYYLGYVPEPDQETRDKYNLVMADIKDAHLNYCERISTKKEQERLYKETLNQFKAVTNNKKSRKIKNKLNKMKKEMQKEIVKHNLAVMRNKSKDHQKH